MSAKGMGDKRPAAIASAGDAASGAKAAMHTPYGRLRNRARTRSVRPPRPVRCAIRARVARRTAAARPARKPPPIPRRGADPGPVCLPREKMRDARFCAVAFLSGVPMPQPGLHAPCVPAWPPNTATAQFARHIVPRWPSSGTKSAIRRRRGRRSAQRNHIPIIHKLFVKCKFNEELFIKYSFFIAFNDPDPPEWPCEPVRHSGCCARYRRAL